MCTNDWRLVFGLSAWCQAEDSNSHSPLGLADGLIRAGSERERAARGAGEFFGAGPGMADR